MELLRARMGVGRHRSRHRSPPRPLGFASLDGEPAERPFSGIHAPAHLRAADPADRSFTEERDRGFAGRVPGPCTTGTFGGAVVPKIPHWCQDFR
ncbi:hypothetical protein GCM10010357_71220 [Streptomyces luteireticuli]|uniref:Uncharacterized protein n=1 Tax=Streptomyces luteireticuli TaxID=173858 RepID=A0ABN0Z918_9ACTN